MASSDPSSRRRKRRGRPCSICGKWFIADARVRHCQRTCLQAECRAEQERRTRASWSWQNPGYWTERRLGEQVNRLEEGRRSSSRKPVMRPPPAEVAEIPADFVQEAMGTKGYVITVLLVRMLFRMTQEAMDGQRHEIMEEIGRMLPGDPQEAFREFGFFP